MLNSAEYEHVGLCITIILFVYTLVMNRITVYIHALFMEPTNYLILSK